MTSTSAPDGLARALRTIGVDLAGPVGVGGSGPQWSAVGDDGLRWTVTSVTPRSPHHSTLLRARAERLAQLDHDHLGRVGRMIDLPRGRLALLSQEVPGTDLATIGSVKTSWTDGEVVTLLVPVAGALATLHGAGLTHGDVSAANVVVTPDGRAVLVDLLCGADAAERGTPDVVAPERAAGAFPPGDVHALAALGLELLDGRPRSRGWVRSAGTDAGAGQALVEVLRRVTASPPQARPSAADLAAEIFALCRPTPLVLPEPAVLARAALMRLGDRSSAAQTQRVAKVGRPKGRHRRRRRPRTLALVATAVALAAGTTAAVLATVSVDPVAAASDAAPEGERSVPGRGDARPDPLAAAILLTHARAQALASGNRAELMAVTVPGSPAALADAAVAPAVARSRPAGPAHVEIVRAGLRAPDAMQDAQGDCGACARVLVLARVGLGWRIEQPSARAVVLVLRPAPDGWRVSDVQGAR